MRWPQYCDNYRNHCLHNDVNTAIFGCQIKLLAQFENSTLGAFEIFRVGWRSSARARDAGRYHALWKCTNSYICQAIRSAYQQGTLRVSGGKKPIIPKCPRDT